MDFLFSTRYLPEKNLSSGEIALSRRSNELPWLSDSACITDKNLTLSSNFVDPTVSIYSSICLIQQIYKLLFVILSGQLFILT